MVRSDPIDSVGAIDGTAEVDGDGEAAQATGGETGWTLVAEHDGAAALVGALLRLDEETAYTKTELSDLAGVAYKTLYLDGTVEALVEAGLLESDDRDGEETAFRVVPDSPAFEAAAAFDEAARDEPAESV